MEALEETMRKHNINLDPSSSNSFKLALSTLGFSFNATSTTYFNEWLIDSRKFYHIAKDKVIFSSLNKCNTKKLFW